MQNRINEKKSFSYTQSRTNYLYGILNRTLVKLHIYEKREYFNN